MSKLVEVFKCHWFPVACHETFGAKVQFHRAEASLEGEQLFDEGIATGRFGCVDDEKFLAQDLSVLAFVEVIIGFDFIAGIGVEADDFVGGVNRGLAESVGYLEESAFIPEILRQVSAGVVGNDIGKADFQGNAGFVQGIGPDVVFSRSVGRRDIDIRFVKRNERKFIVVFCVIFRA